WRVWRPAGIWAAQVVGGAVRHAGDPGARGRPAQLAGYTGVGGLAAGGHAPGEARHRPHRRGGLTGRPTTPPPIDDDRHRMMCAAPANINRRASALSSPFIPLPCTP